MHKIIAGFVYLVFFHYSYVTFVNPQYEYAGYNYNEVSPILCIFTYLICLLPLLFSVKTSSPAYSGICLIYSICYIPAQFMMGFSSEMSTSMIALSQSVLGISMIYLLKSSKWGWVHCTNGSNKKNTKIEYTGNKRMELMILGATIFSLLILLDSYHQTMRLVSLEEIYDLRLGANATDRGDLVNYTSMWLGSCFLPYFFSIGYIHRRLTPILIAMLGSLLLYAAMGSKAAIFMAIMMGYIYYITRDSEKDLMRSVLSTLSVIVLFVTLVIPEEGMWLLVKAVIIVRTIVVAGWTMVAYESFFSENGYTYYTHIGPVNYVFESYPYGSLGLGRVIGLKYSGTTDVNFNANFWASDGFAALGLIGIPIATVALSLFIYILNRVSIYYSPRFVALWLTGFWLVLLNAPVTTSILSGGGAIIVLLLAIYSPQKNRTVGPILSRSRFEILRIAK